MSQSEILNYDPSRYGVQVTGVQPVTIIRPDGKVFRLLFSSSELEGKTIEEKNRIVFQTLRIYERLDVIFSNDRLNKFNTTSRVKRRLSDEQGKQAFDAIVSEFAWLTARTIALNVVAIYIERAKTEEVIDRRNPPDAETCHKIIDSLLERISHQLKAAIQNDQDAANELDRCIQENMMAAAALTAQRHQEITGGRPIEDIWNISRHYLHSRAKSFYKSTVEKAAENYAAHLLEDFIRPAQMLIESLRAYIYDSFGKRLSSSDAITLLKNLLRGQVGNIVVWERSDGSLDFRVRPFDTKKQEGPPSGILENLLRQSKSGRRADPNKKEKLQEYREFAELTHKRRYIAEFLSEFGHKNSNGNWFEMLKSDYEFEQHCREYEAKGHDVAIIREAAKTAYDYHRNTDLMIKDETKWKRATSALGIAQIIASLEMNWRDENDSPLDATILRNRYNKVALKWVLRKRPSTNTSVLHP